MSDTQTKRTEKISPEKITEYIKNGLKKEGLEVASDVEFNVSVRYESHDTWERVIHYFDGCAVDVKPITGEL